ncbi:helix-turn-helix domain-containing protein [Streptomyces sp. UNOB3_S3]|uniref:nSTAND1 domain-containing NTPase n=1 Tax=Streptomyces sp. UNOB3_S3 TaxID=2871682 RepID=UPI001E4230A6|nr:helix-turn-helix domain-containing protein [Streptomyces sp. UNOB3_S3]MCC3777848.1 helix-turn-helix domain-containing protein [Streptomyces sp. UNOB3_S3]
MEGRGHGAGGPAVDTPSSGTEHAGERLRRLRLERGVPLAKLARSAFYSKGYLSKVENGEKPLTPDLARACDQALDTGGVLQLLVGTPESGGGSRPRDEGACPYRGLSPFGAEDARWFFGRDEAVAGVVSRLTERLRAPGPLMVMAPSGAGKSSLLRAGLVPALRRGVLPVPGSHAWPVILLTPGDRPVEELLDRLAKATGAPRRLLGKALEDGPGTLAATVRAATDGLRPADSEARIAPVIVVDQFEETFTLCHDVSERLSFVAALLALAGDRQDAGDGVPTALVVLGARADFYDRCLAHPGLATSLQHGHVTLGPMSDAQLRDAIVAPAREAGLKVEPGLVEVLLRDIGLTPVGTGDTGVPGAGALPLLSHALLGTWQHRENATLTVAGYRLTGGVSGAVAATAERAYTSLGPEQRVVAQRVLLQLVHVGAEKETGHRTRREELLGSGPSQETVGTVLEVFTHARLLTMDTDHVELAHEILLHAWPRLRRWIENDRAELRGRQLVADSAAMWESAGRDEGLLYRGSLLAAAGRWLKDPESGAALTPTARAYLEASIERGTAEKLRQQRGVRRLRALASGLAMLLVLALVAGVVAFQQYRTAQTQRGLAVSRERAARADSLAAGRPEAAMLTALSGYRQAPTVEARSSLLGAYAQYHAQQLTGHDRHVNAVAFSPDGRMLATASADHSVKLWDTATREVLATLSGHTDSVEGVAFSPDGRTLATVGVDRSVKLWDVTTHRLITTLLGHRDAVTSVAFSPDGHTVATAGFDRTVRLWDVGAQRQVAALTGHTDFLYGVAFSPDGHTLASVGSDRTARLWDVASRTLRATLTGHTDTLQGVAFSPDGRTLATTSRDRTVRLWDVPAHRQTATLTGHTQSVSGVAFSPDGRTVASGGYDRTARLWDVATGEPVAALDACADEDVVTAVAFSPDGHTLVTANTGVAFADLWEVSTRNRLGTLSGRPVRDAVARFSPDGGVLAIGDARGTIRLRDTRTLRPLAAFTGSTAGLSRLAFTPDGHGLAGVDDKGSVRFWDTTTQRQTAALSGDAGPVNAVAYSPDGRVLATAGADGTARLWDTATLRQISALTGHRRDIIDMVFSPDGHTLATAGADGTARLWDTRTRRSLAAFSHPDTVSAVAFSPDGRTLATACKDRSVRLWAVSTRRRTATLTGHTLNVRGLAFSPDGRTLATTSGDHTIRLWDPAGRRTRAVLTTGTSQTSPAFSPDGRTLVTASVDGSARLWALVPDDVAGQVCELGRKHRWGRLIPGLPRDTPCA